MAFNYNGNGIADIELAAVSGCTGVGLSILCFSIHLRVPATAGDGVTLRNFQLKVFVHSSDGRAPQFLGFAQPELPLEVVTKTHTDSVRFLCELPLSEGQLVALEKLRNGCDLVLKLRFAAVADGPQGVRQQHDEVSRRVNLSEWGGVLRDLQGPTYMVIGIALPTPSSDITLTAAVDRISKAHGHLIQGRFDAVVSECRLAIESVGEATGESKARVAAAAKFAQGKGAMSKLERELSLLEAVRHYAHLAHHVDARGTPEYYSRDDANMLLAAASALVSSAIARHQSTKVEQKSGFPS